MIEFNVSTAPCADPKILIGRQCENDAVNIIFDLSFLINKFGDGTATLIHKRARDTAPYIVTATQEDGELIWSVSSTDNAYSGVGLCELRWTVGDVLAKTILYKTYTVKSITADTVIPSVYQSWYDAMIDYIDQLKVDADEGLAAAVASATASATEAATSETNAANSATAAAASEANAESSATSAASSAVSASASAEAAAQSAATSGYMWFYIDEDGYLYLDKTDNVDVSFSIGSDGYLYVEGNN